MRFELDTIQRRVPVMRSVLTPPPAISLPPPSPLPLPERRQYLLPMETSSCSWSGLGFTGECVAGSPNGFCRSWIRGNEFNRAVAHEIGYGRV